MIISLCIVALVIMAETTADLLAVGEIISTDVDKKRIVAGLRADMGTTAIAPVFNGFPISAFAQNVGMVALTGIKSRFVVAAGGGILVVLGLLPVLGRVMNAIPQPVLGGAGIVLFGSVAAAGIRTLSRVNFTNSNVLIVAASIGVGIIPITARCDRRNRIDHRTDVDHECDARCVRHACKPLGASYLRQIHTVLNGAFTHAVRWRWIGTNPVRQAEAPPQPAPDPNPPSPTQAARIVEEAWRDPDWGMFVWLAMTTGARRGELCALRWDRIDFATGVLDIRTAIAQVNTRTWEKDTKTHQRRRIVADAQTLALLQAYLHYAAQTAASLDVELAEGSFVFSGSPDRNTWLKPDTVTQRYSRMCERLGWDMHIHQLRHYSATELIAAGVDIRTVAGRLGHGGGGTTTLRVYSAWVAEADQRAASSLAARMPALPVAASSGDGTPALPLALVVDVASDDSPYRMIAADLQAAIRCGALTPGDCLPTVKSLSARYSVSEGTAHRAIALLGSAGVIAVSRGRRAVVVKPDQ